MTLISSIQNVANECGYTIDSSIVGSTDVTTKRLLAMANRIIREMHEAYMWPKLWKSGTITLVASQATYALPGDFSYYHYDTFWNQDERWPLYGPITPQYKAEIDGFGLTADVYDRYAIRGATDSELFLSPTPGSGDAGETLIFEYQSARPVRPATWESGASYAAGAYTFYNGNYYSTTAGGTAGGTAPTHTSGSASDGGVTWIYYSDAYLEFLADTDVPQINSRIFEQGIIELFSSRHGLAHEKLFSAQLDEEYSKLVPGRVFNVAHRSNSGTWGRNGSVRFRS